ncbi:MAG: hypothetical protein KJ072_17415 [Verrucomicrobia bacterium]|nr:hypothetical protein [Verrucomicrobiota bacterium]
MKPLNYFLADLPPGTSFSPTMIAEACQALKHNRAQYLASKSTLNLIETLADVAADWCDPHNPIRQLALKDGPAATGFSAPVLARGLDQFFGQLTADRLRQLVFQDLGHLDRLDRFVATEPEHQTRRLALATSPELLVHITAGNLPVPALMSIVLGLLVRSAQFVKCATGTSWLPRMLAHSIHARESKLAACLEIAEWPGGNTPLETVLFEQADCVTATGRDETLTALRLRLPPQTRFVGYGHRVSFGYVSREMLSQSEARQLTRAAARDVSAWDQSGCLSPHLYYVETGGTIAPRDFAEQLATALAELEAVEPRGQLPPAEAAEISTRRAVYELRAAQSLETQLWQSPQSTAWTVIYEEDPRFQTSCLNRFVYVKPARNLADTLQQSAAFSGRVSTVGLAACGDKLRELSTALARWGVARVCPIGRMQDPALPWRHDGRPTLNELVTWTDWEL